jgi:hypothetical protein
MTIIFNRKSITAFFCWALLLFANPVYSQQARLTNLVVTSTRDDLLIFLTIEGAFTENMKAAILSGVPTTVSFNISLEKIRNLWLNRKVVDKNINHTIKYNPLRKEFTVKRSWESDPIVTESFAEAINLMADVDSFKIASLNVLEKGVHYQIRAKAKLDKLTLPFYLHYVFFFLTLWDFETDWYMVNFYY